MLQPKDTDWLNGYRNKTHIYAVYKRPNSDLGIHTDWKWEDKKKIFHANGNQKKAVVEILISDKIYFKIKTLTRDKEGYYKMIKGSIQEEDITIINIYAPNTGAPQYIRQVQSISSKIRNKTTVSTLATIIQHSLGSPSHSNQGRIRNKRNPNWKRRSKTVTVCRRHDTIHR